MKPKKFDTEAELDESILEFCGFYKEQDEKNITGFCGLKNGEEIVTRAISEAIKNLHAAGLPSSHMDEQGVYKLYPDGHKEYA